MKNIFNSKTYITNQKNSHLIDGIADKNTKVKLCKMFSTGILLNPQLLTLSQNSEFNIYNSQLAKAQFKFIQSETKSQRVESLKKMEENIFGIDNFLSDNKIKKSIKSIFVERNKVFEGQDFLDFMEQKYEVQKEIIYNHRNYQNQDYILASHNALEKKLPNFLMMLQDISENNFKNKLKKESDVSWKLGYSSLEITDPSLFQDINLTLLSVVDFVEEIGVQEQVAGINGLIGLKFISDNPDVRASFIPSTSQISIQKLNDEALLELRSTLMHEWTHAIDIVSIEQGYPGYKSSVSGQTEVGRQNHFQYSSEIEKSSNNDFIPVVEAMENLTISMFSKESSLNKKNKEIRENDILQSFYEQIFDKDWKNIEQETKRKLFFGEPKQIAIKWLSSNGSEIIQTSLLDTIKPILEKDYLKKFSESLKNKKFTPSQFDLERPLEIKKDSEYSKLLEKNYKPEFKKLMFKSFFQGPQRFMSTMNWIQQVKDIQSKYYYYSPEEMLARQMESTFFPKEVELKKQLQPISSVYYPPKDNEEFKKNAEGVFSSLEKACHVKPKSIEDIINSYDTLRSQLKENIINAQRASIKK